MIPTGTLGMQVLVRAWVPMDDEHTMYWSIGSCRARAMGRGGAGGASGLHGRGPASRGGRRARPAASSSCPTPPTGSAVPPRPAPGNDYLIDREAQARGELHRHRGHPPAGPGRHREHGPDLRPHAGAPRHHRRDDHPHATPRSPRPGRCATSGAIPPGVDNPEIYRQRSGGVILPRSADW